MTPFQLFSITAETRAKRQSPLQCDHLLPKHTIVDCVPHHAIYSPCVSILVQRKHDEHIPFAIQYLFQRQSVLLLRDSHLLDPSLKKDPHHFQSFSLESEQATNQTNTLQTMKFISATFLLSTSTLASAFMAHQPSFVVSKTQLSAVHPDATAAIEAAVKASKNFGPTSPEARVAWDIVEEVSASDNR